MFFLDSMLISGIQWALKTALTAAEAEMNDDTVLREQLLEAEMRRETGEITDAEFTEIEADLLTRIREIKQRREGDGPLAFGSAEPIETSSDSTFQIEAEVSGDFHDGHTAPETTVVAVTPTRVEEVVVTPTDRPQRSRSLATRRTSHPRGTSEAALTTPAKRRRAPARAAASAGKRRRGRRTKG